MNTAEDTAALRSSQIRRLAKFAKDARLYAETAPSPFERDRWRFLAPALEAQAKFISDESAREEARADAERRDRAA